MRKLADIRPLEPASPRTSRRRRVVVSVIAAAGFVGAFGVPGLGVVTADAADATTTGVPAPYVATQPSGDPHPEPCQFNNQNGVCLYTSQDLAQGRVTAGYPSYNPNGYPMTNTLGYFSTDGVNWQGPWTLMSESTYVSQGWTPNGAEHLWAPDAHQGADGNWYLYVPDLSDTMHPSDSSFIGVFESTSGPMGPFNIPVGQVQMSGGPVGNIGYASDPDIIDTATGRMGPIPYIYWNDRDNGNLGNGQVACGGISVAPLNSDMYTVGTPTRLQFTGIPSSWGWCNDTYGRAHPYMEGPHVYDTSLAGWPAGTPGPFLMVVPIKPVNTPPQCASSVQGQPGTSNQLVAWLTSDSPTGPFAYGGVIMCGSLKEWTQQGGIFPMKTSGNTQGRTPLIYIYHDANPTANGHNRTLHAECLFFGNGRLAESIRTAGTQPSQSGAEADCLNGMADKNTVGIQSASNGMFVSQNGNNTLTVNRYGVGPWEHFTFFAGHGTQPLDPTSSMTSGSILNGSWGSDVAGLATATSSGSNITTTSGSGNTSVFNFMFSNQNVQMSSVQTGQWVQTVGSNLRAGSSSAPSFVLYHQ